MIPTRRAEGSLRLLALLNEIADEGRVDARRPRYLARQWREWNVTDLDLLVSQGLLAREGAGSYTVTDAGWTAIETQEETARERR